MGDWRVRNDSSENGNKSEINIISLPSDLSVLKNHSMSGETIETQSFKTKKWPQIYAAITAHIGGFGLGTCWVWTATAIPDLVKSGELGLLTKTEKSWITSAPFLGALCVCPFTGYCMGRFGRRKTMLCLTVPFAMGWFLITFGQNIPAIYVGRLITGACSGSFTQVVPIFIAESVEKSIRGSLMCMFEMLICLGSLFMDHFRYIVGTYTTWRNQALVCGMVPVLCFFMLIVVPESPLFLMENKKYEAANKALRWLRGASSNEQISNELFEISESVRSKGQQNNLGWRALRDKSILKPILISLGLTTFFQGSFINPILAGTVEIFEAAGSYNEYLSTIVIGGTQVAATVIPFLFADNCGRRFLLMISLIFITISLTSLGIYFHFKYILEYSSIQNYGWVPLASLVLYVVACSIGLTPLTWVIVAEIAPPKAKGLAASIVGVWNRIVGFTVIYIFWDLMELLGQNGGFWFIALISLTGLVFVIFFIPETKGKSLDEIQLHFVASEMTKL